ncbi:hypothetical protein [Dethiobacter alkaliphilus]|uniref:hypothetical protein n=1 Tax=Dethiobacter alkaliphilus TaxID=427926 RepID=UPI002227183E|nr:hypothetical protein [Dethiobacter alkaliphilus]MCW3489756.1 hypothetical protein [Dethiobacter alkaliphilus]
MAGACFVLFIIVFLWSSGEIGSNIPLSRELGLSFMLKIGLISLILLHIADIREIILPAKKKNLEKISIAVAVVVIGSLAFFFGQGLLINYIIAALGATVVILGGVKKGITSRSFNVIGEINIWGNWSKIEKVELSTKEDVNFLGNWKQKIDPDNGEVAVLIHRKMAMRKEVHYYDKDDFEKVLSLLKEHLPAENIKIRDQASIRTY